MRNLHLLLLVSTASAVAVAQSNKPLQPVTLPKQLAGGPELPADVAPADLKDSLRQQTYSAAAASVGSPVFTVAPPPAFARLTPLTLRTAGARVESTSGLNYVMPSASSANGGWKIVRPYIPTGATTPGGQFITNRADARLALQIDAVVGKMYFVDCAIRPPSGFTGSTQVQFGASGVGRDNTSVANASDHYVFAFRAAEARTTVSAKIPFDGSAYGCDITRVD